MATIVSLALYAILIECWAPAVHAGQDQESDNLIAIEHFLYDAPPQAVVVGSSMADRIPSAALGPGVESLALAGQSPLVGLEIVARSERTPQRLYLETNNLALVPDEALSDSLFTEPGYTLRRHVKALRQAYQPVNLAIALLRRATRGRDEVYYPPLYDPALHEALVARLQAQLGQVSTSALLANLSEMKRLADLMTQRGTEIVFFEMPIDPQLERAAGVVTARHAAHATFPADRYCWNATAPPAGLPSTDGLHLDSETAAGFGADLVKTVCRKRAVPPH